MVNQSKPVFYDEQQRRWRRTRRMLEIAGVIFTLVFFTFFFSLLSDPALPQLLPVRTPNVLRAVKDGHNRGRTKNASKRPRKRRIAALGKLPQNYDPVRVAFYVPWDASSLASLKQHYRNIDVLVPEALHATSPDGRLDREQDEKLQRFLSGLQASGIELPTMALVNNYSGRDWKSREMEQYLSSEAARRRLVQSLVLYATTSRQAGIVADFEEIPRTSQKDYEKFIQELGEGLHAANLKLMVSLPAADSDYDYASYAARCDAIILMNYDQHWLTSTPGPIAAQDWYTRNLVNTLKVVKPEKIVAGIANYAYDWAETKGTNAQNKAISFQQSIVTAQESEAQVEFDSDSLNPHFSYEENNITHHVWIMDAVTAYNEERAAGRLGVRGTALWRLGSEDPSMWAVWDATAGDDRARAKLRELPPGYDLVLEGDGDIWRITATPEPGRRDFDYDADTDTITDETFTRYPLPYRIDQEGAQTKKVALSFDDGPDPRFTPKILDILRDKHVPAAFFVIGTNAANDPALLRREYNEGHEIGNHTWTHPHFDDISNTHLDMELQLTQRLLESEVGVKTLLFRPPYGIDHQPEYAEEVRMLPYPQKLGYILVGSKIDPHDWGEAGGQPPPPTSVIAQRVVDQAEDGKGNIVLMHDGGGDRTRTVEALPEVIDHLRANGYELVSVSALLNETRAQTMPVLNARERWLARADAAIFNLYHFLRLGIAWIFLLGIGLVSLRALIIGVLAVIEKFLPDEPENPLYRPRVSVLIPAYNEEEAIVQTVSSVLASSYDDFEVIVVDDGSRDATGELLEENFAREPRVRIVHQPNRGKPAALNSALDEARGEIVVTIDADTVIEPDAIARLTRHFVDPEVAAVAGNAKVANRKRWLTRWQALEYITAQNLEKRAFHMLNCITVVPGAIGAWRASELRRLGGFSHETVAEDTDITLAMRRAGRRILYDEHAIARTNAPDTAAALIRQRFRWTFGTLQAVWKHRDTVGKPRYGTLGMVAIPNIFLFQILLPLVSPVIDLLFLGSLALWGLGRLNVVQLGSWTNEDVERSLFFFVAFMLIDFLTCVVAFLLEKKEEWSLLLPLLLQRFYYRQMMYVVLFRALKRAVQGSAVGWGRIEPKTPAPPAKVTVGT